ncbi:MAG: hypothetical protein WCK82_10060 [Bacteroidota bacterium]
MKINTLKNSFILFQLLFCLTLFSACFCVKIAAKSDTTVKSKAIPPTFGQEKTILLIPFSTTKRYNKLVKKHATKRYHGEYIFLEMNDIYTEKYKDVHKYRYIFSSEFYTPFNSSTNKSKFFIIDRVTNETFYCPASSSFYSGVIEAYMINLERVRLKYEH